MNCKPGDLAVVVSVPDARLKHHLGRVIECVKLVYHPDGSPCWQLRQSIPDPAFMRGTRLEAIADRNLRPLRDNDGQDEMLRIAGHPNKEIA